MSRTHVILGICGHASGGKDTASDYLASEYGFVHISTSQLIRDYILQNKLGSPTRSLMNKVATKLRKQFGGDYLVRDAIEKNKSAFLVLSGLRSSDEAAAIKESNGFIINVDSSVKTRYQREKARGRIGDKISYSQFLQQEKKEEAPKNVYAPNVSSVIAKADFHVNNELEISNLYTQLDDILRQFKIFKKNS